MSPLLWSIPILLLVALAGAMTLFYLRPNAALAHLSRRALRKAGAEQRTVDGPRGPLRYFVLGEGPTVVLLHGAGDQAGTWARTAPRLAEKYRLLMPDLPGHGGSEPTDGPLNHGDMADGLAALLDHEAPREAVALVGNSMGGWTSLLHASRLAASGTLAERLRVLILENSGGISGVDLKARLGLGEREAARKLYDDILGPRLDRPRNFVLDDFLRRVRSGPLAHLLASDEAPFHLDGKLGEVNIPAHLVWGEDDGLLPLDYARRLAAELPNSMLHAIERCGHIPHIEAREDYLEIVERVLAAP